MKAGKTTSDVYSIDPDGQGAFDVFCDQNTTQGGGYVVIQRRKDGSVDFFRNWITYQNRFGYLKGEFWLGLDNIHRLTSQTKNQLRVDLTDWEEHTAYAEYSGFTVDGESTNYIMDFDSFVGGKLSPPIEWDTDIEINTDTQTHKHTQV